MIKDEYIEFVEHEAMKLGKCFVLDSGEGNDFIDEKTGWNIENLSGWLVDPNLADEVRKAKDTSEEDKYNDYFIFVKWKKDEESNLNVNFIKIEP